MTRSSDIINRRNFLRGAAVAGATAALPATGEAAAADASAPRAVAVPTAAQTAAETAPPPRMTSIRGKVGADFMVDTLKSLGIEYIAANPGASLRGLHESIINYGQNRAPELLTCLHEEAAVAMAHGYAKIAGKPMAFMGHGSVGLQHASMGLYNAWCDRAPVLGILGNHFDATKRRPGVEWVHSAQDAVAIVRDFVKWDDAPPSLQHFAESTIRAHKIATTPPYGPALIVADAALQEAPIENEARLAIPKPVMTTPPAGEGNAVREAARLLAAAENPVIIADRAARTPEGMRLLVELAEALNAPVIDLRSRMNFPNTHDLFQAERRAVLIKQADVILGLELMDFWGQVNSFADNIEQSQAHTARPDAKLISISSLDLFSKSNFQDFQRFQSVDVAMAADAEATLPALIEAVKSAIPAATRARIAARGEMFRADKAAAFEASRQAAVYAWDASPISTARIAAELWAQIHTEDWSLVSRDHYSGWARRLWKMDRHYQYIGGPGGEGQGYFLPAAIGAALANRAHGRLSVSFQPDGDLMYSPGALWTAVHHQIPVLLVMHNNRAYHQEVMHVQRMASRHNRGIDRASIGNAIDNPVIDYATLAKSMGMWAEGPISDPAKLGPALKRAIAVVKSGAPALLDVISQPR